jgi:hypothetical protein
MQRVAVLTLVVLFGLAVAAQADPVVTLGTYNVQPNTASTAIQIFAYNDPTTGPNSSVKGIDLNIAVHDISGSGSEVGAPVFTAGLPGQGFPANSPYVGGTGLNGGVGGDIVTGTIFGAVAGHGQPTDGGISNANSLNSITIALGGVSVPLGTAGTPSLIATVYINTVGVVPGTNWILAIGGGMNGDPGADDGPLDFSDGGLFNTQLTDGIIAVGNIVPEPSSVVMALFAAAGLAAVAIRRARRA